MNDLVLPLSAAGRGPFVRAVFINGILIHALGVGTECLVREARALTMSADLRRDAVPEVAAYYASYAEESRLTQGSSRLEFDRTKEILTRVLPAAPARIVDVGGAAGAYSLWLADRGYDVHLVDAAPRLVEEARRRNEQAPKRIASLTVADARSLPQGDGTAAAVLVLGPLYHLTTATDRVTALREAFRVLASGGTVVAAAISRYASALDGLARKLTRDPRFVEIRNRDLADGQHRDEGDSRPRSTVPGHVRRLIRFSIGVDQIASSRRSFHDRASIRSVGPG